VIVVGPPIIIKAVYCLAQRVESEFSNRAVRRLSTKVAIITIKASGRASLDDTEARRIYIIHMANSSR
jgi:hypothetical protein